MNSESKRVYDMHTGYLLACVSEEAGELVQAVGKCQRFGLDSVNPNNGQYNLASVIDEYNDLMVVMKLLGSELGIEDNLNRPQDYLDDKCHRVLKYMKEYADK